jgi:dihydrodiol dehydrogenase / D-xylose 1-dehydrogenase (NADP)
MDGRVPFANQIKRKEDDNVEEGDTAASVPSPPACLECPPIRWGILGCGRVAHDFCLALRLLPTQSVAACAAASGGLERAGKFAALHGIPRRYGTYEELLRDAGVDVVYVANLHKDRLETVELCLRHRRNVLVEKPLAMSGGDAARLVEMAKESGAFLMEGMWTRFFPAFQLARDLLERGTVGTVRTVLADFCIDAGDHEEYPASFFYQPSLGGGANLLVGPYPVAAAIAAFGSQTPATVRAAGLVDPQTGADLHASVVLGFGGTDEGDGAAAESSEREGGGGAGPPVRPGSGTASITYGILCESEELTVIVGTKGRITLAGPSHTPTSLKLEIKGKGRGASAKTKLYHFPLPEDDPALMERTGGYHYPRSAGFCYEAAAVARCVSRGLKEAPQYTWAESVATLRVLDQVNAQIRHGPERERERDAKEL